MRINLLFGNLHFSFNENTFGSRWKKNRSDNNKIDTFLPVILAFRKPCSSRFVVNQLSSLRSLFVSIAKNDFKEDQPLTFEFVTGHNDHKYNKTNKATH